MSHLNMEKKIMNFYLFEIVNNVSGNRENLVKVNSVDCSMQKAERIVKQNYPNSLFTEYFNGGFTADEPMCEEIFWKVNYKWRKKYV
tara:strand:+ start:253 stop:513 length:261 start_codon:yes stop_codon:yes gene_type:complete